MTSASVVAARKLDGPEPKQLYLLEMAKKTPIPSPMTQVQFEGQAYMVAGVVDYGDGKGPIVLGLQLDEGEPEAAPS